MISIPFEQWFTLGNVIGGDWRFFWTENIQEIISYSFAWDPSLNTGLGRSNLPILWLNSYLAYGAHFLTQLLHIPWGVAEKLLFFWPIVPLSFLSAFSLSKRYSGTRWSILSGIIYLTNTYALMIFSGGQVGVGLAYSVTPFVLLSFMKVIDNVILSPQNLKFKISDFQFPIGVGMVLALQVLFDPRIAVLSMIMVTIYFLIRLSQVLRIALSTFVFVFIIPGIVVGLIHAFWILPMILFRINPADPYGQVFSSGGLTKFFSFASFENAFSLLHPNWPENIFGKIYFMRPEFLLLPTIVFSSLLLIKKKTEKTKPVLFFVILALFGAFLAKGANPPFGEIYIWLIEHVQIFAMFRDPTKWYILVAISYSVLIPVSLRLISERVYIRGKSSRLFFVLFILYFIFLLKPLFLGELKGTFFSHTVPGEYGQLREFIGSQPEFFRTLWMPKVQRFGYFSNDHPIVSKDELFGVSGTQDIGLIQEKTKVLLQEAAVKYIIVPFDSESEIFLTDRKYDNKKYTILINDIGKIAFLNKVDGFGKIALFEVSLPKDHFFFEDAASRTQLTYQRKNPTKYIVNIHSGKKGQLLVFSERYDNNWVAKVKNTQTSSIRFHGLFNSFILSENGDYSLEIFYLPQRFVVIGSFVSILSLFLFGLVILKRK